MKVSGIDLGARVNTPSGVGGRPSNATWAMVPSQLVGGDVDLGLGQHGSDAEVPAQAETGVVGRPRERLGHVEVVIARKCYLPAKSTGDVEDQAQHLTDLGERCSTDVSSCPFDSASRDGTDVLTLGDRCAIQPVFRIGVELHLRRKPSQLRCQRHDLNDTGPGVENPLGGYDDRWVAKSRLSAKRQPEIQLDDITRGQHRAIPLPRQ